MSKNKKILIVDQPHPYLIEQLTKWNFVCEEHTTATKEEIGDIIHQYFGIVIRSRIKLDKSLLTKAKKLQFIARAGAGLESIDVTYATRKKIKCISSPEGNRDAVGEQAIGMLLCMFNNICRANQQVRKGQWIREGNRGIELKGKTVGVIGYGNMGKAFAKKLKGFDVRIIAYDKYKIGYGDEYVQEVGLQTLFSESDVISLHIPYSTSNHYFVNADFLSNFHKPIYVINTARGIVLNSEDLVEQMKKGKVLGAALDVIEYEGLSFETIDTTDLPEAFQYLIESDSVVLSPHIAGWTVESKRKHAEVLAEKIRQAFV